MQISRECTPPYLSTGISNLLQPAQAEVVLSQRSTYLASWVYTQSLLTIGRSSYTAVTCERWLQEKRPSITLTERGGKTSTQEAKCIESWPNTTSAWAGWSRLDIPVHRNGGVHSLLICTSSTLPAIRLASRIILIEQNIKNGQGQHSVYSVALTISYFYYIFIQSYQDLWMQKSSVYCNMVSNTLGKALYCFL